MIGRPVIPHRSPGVRPVLSGRRLSSHPCALFLCRDQGRSAVNISSLANGASCEPSARHCTESISRDKKAPQSLRGSEVGCAATLGFSATRSVGHGKLRADIDLSVIDPRGGLTRLRKRTWD
jgi:hypothetical protein